MSKILKLSKYKYNEKKEIDFELKYLMSLTINQRFKMLFAKTKQVQELLYNNGFRTINKVIKRK